MKNVIGIRYCGGCKAEYDRVKAVKQFLDSHPDLDPVYMDDLDRAQKILLVCGCPSACASRDDLADKEISVISSIKDFQNINI